MNRRQLIHDESITAAAGTELTNCGTSRERPGHAASAPNPIQTFNKRTRKKLRFDDAGWSREYTLSRVPRSSKQKCQRGGGTDKGAFDE